MARYLATRRHQNLTLILIVPGDAGSAPYSRLGSDPASRTFYHLPDTAQGECAGYMENLAEKHLGGPEQGILQLKPAQALHKQP